jgi:hypothetical protein
MRRIACICCLVLAVACEKKTDENNMATDTVATQLPTPPTFSAADIAGTWNMRAIKEGTDSVLVSYQMVATGNTEGWQFKFPDRNDPIPVRVLAIEGDSVVTEAGPYPSVLRQGVQVTTHNVMRLQNGMLVGRTEAHYSGMSTADSLVFIRQEGTRAQ